MITKERLCELLGYDPETGLFRWRVNKGGRGGKAKLGSIAGTPRPSGYIAITLDQRPYLAHRLAWLHSYGSFPPFQIDHKNCVKDDNRLENLREATREEQNANKRGWRAGLKGCYRKRGKWEAQIKRNGRSVYLGTFDTEEIAHAAYAAAAKLLFGEFARVA